MWQCQHGPQEQNVCPQPWAQGNNNSRVCSITVIDAPFQAEGSYWGSFARKKWPVRNFISEMLASKIPTSSDLQAAYRLQFFIDGHCLKKQADTFCTGSTFQMNSGSAPNPAHYINLALEHNMGEIIYCIYSHTHTPLKMTWCLWLLVVGTINILTAYCLPFQWRSLFSTLRKALWIVQQQPCIILT